MKLDDSILAQLHGDLADAYAEALRKFKEEGEVPPANLLTSIANFLKHNGITCGVGTDDEESLKRLRAQAESATEYPFDPDTVQ